MITAQDIREKTFERSRMNGYDMASVDEFLEDIAATITDMQKENTILRGKMKVLVDKIEEYRSNEESLNRALLSAQKLAVQIESDARTRADAVVAEARSIADSRLGSLESEALDIENRIANGKKAMEDFYNSMKASCEAQIERVAGILNGTFIVEPEVETALEETSAELVADQDSYTEYDSYAVSGDGLSYQPAQESVYDAAAQDAPAETNDITQRVVSAADNNSNYESAFRFEFTDLKNRSADDQMTFDF